MKVLVTGGTGGLGRAVCTKLARSGVEPVAMARHEPATLPKGVRFVAADVRDRDAVRRAVQGCHAVVHLAWFMGVGAAADEIRSVNIDGTKTLLDAMDAEGCRRIAFASSVTAYGSAENRAPFRESDPLRPSTTFLYAAQKAEVEGLLAARGFDAVIARATIVLGRQVDNGTSQSYAGPRVLDIGGRSVIQAIHEDDVGRFFSAALLGGRTGTVNLAAAGSISIARAAELLERKVLKIPASVAYRSTDLINRLGVQGIDADVARLFAHWPVVDTTELNNAWGFTPVWDNEETFRDQARRSTRSTYLVSGGKEKAKARRLPWADTVPYDVVAHRPDAAWQHAAPEGVRGSFDDLVDPAFPLYSGTNLHEAFPGPMTPLSLELHRDGLDCASDGLIRLLGLTGERAETLRLGVRSYGHYVYTNVSAVLSMAEWMPGADPADIERMYLGIDRPSEKKPRPSASDAALGAKFASRMMPRLAGFGAEVDRQAAEAERFLAIDPSTLTDDELVVHLELLHDVMCEAWFTTSMGNVFLGGLASALDGEEPPTDTAGAATLRWVNELSTFVRNDAALRDLLGDDTVTAERLRSVRAAFPSFALRVDEALRAVGHRGPGETELENPVFADRPELLLDVVRRAASTHSTVRRVAASTPSRSKPAKKIALSLLHNKERMRDVAIRLVHCVRLAARERGKRLAAAGALGAPELVHYLRFDELVSSTLVPPSVLAARVAERQRLKTYRMPLRFDGTWEPEAIADQAGTVGTVLRGVAAVGGVYEGIVRVMHDPLDELEPGDIMCAVTTDIGWTPFFALAGAVLTDVGGIASHAAIVAREYALPSVVGLREATTTLRSGMRIRVDGTAGTVEILEVPA